MAKKVEKAVTGFILLSADNINKLIDKAVKTTKSGIGLIHEAAVQCMAHAEKHGDVTLMARLVQSVKDECEGYVVAGLRFWAEQNSPIKLSIDKATGQVKAKLIKEGEEGYKPFNTEGASESPAHKMEEVRGRAQKTIEPLSVTSLKANLARLSRMVESAKKDGGRGFAGDTEEDRMQCMKACEAFARKIVWAADNIKLADEPASDEVTKVEAAKAA